MKKENIRQSSLFVLVSAILALFHAASALILQSGFLDKLFWGLGLIILITGVIILLKSIWQYRKGGSYLNGFFAAVLSILTGGAMVFFTRDSLTAVMFVVGLWFIFVSVYVIYLLVVLKPKQPTSVIMWISILLSLGFGILILYHPVPEQKNILNLEGFLGLFTGLAQAWLGVFLFSAKKQKPSAAAK